MYRGKVCSPYITDGTYIYVDTQKTTSSQDFIEKKLSVGFIEMNKLLSNSCKSYSLPFLCHYHFPECSMGRTPKMICKNECELVKTKYCKTEYKLAGIGHSNSSEDDLFPDCNTLPKGTGRTNCISLGRHFPPPQIQSGKEGFLVIFSINTYNLD